MSKVKTQIESASLVFSEGFSKSYFSKLYVSSQDLHPLQKSTTTQTQEELTNSTSVGAVCRVRKLELLLLCAGHVKAIMYMSLSSKEAAISEDTAHLCRSELSGLTLPPYHPHSIMCYARRPLPEHVFVVVAHTHAPQMNTHHEV